MSFNAAVSVSQNTDARNIVLTDISTGSDAGLTNRLVSFFKVDGTLLGGAVLNWPIAQGSMTFQVLDQDIALNVSVFFVSSAPLSSPSTYTASLIWVANKYGNDFLYSIIQLLTSNPIRMQDKDYWGNISKMTALISSSQNCIDVGKDLKGAQGCVDRYNYMIKNQKYYF